MLRSLIIALTTVSSAFGSLAYAQRPDATRTAASAQQPGHHHAAHGPHGGEILEIGKEEYHAEVVLDEANKQMLVYLLDQEMKSYVAIDSPSLAVNLKMAGKPVQVKLLPLPQEAERPGFSSCFGVVHAALIDALHDAKAEPKLALRIGNKSYVAKIVHEHEHSGHNHAGHNHAAQAHGNAPKKR